MFRQEGRSQLVSGGGNGYLQSRSFGGLYQEADIGTLERVSPGEHDAAGRSGSDLGHDR
jgi:hypothetical protein